MLILGTSFKLFKGRFYQFDGRFFVEEEAVFDELPSKNVQVHEALTWDLNPEFLLDKHTEDISKMNLTYYFNDLW